MPYLGIFGQEFFKKVLSYLKSPHLNLSNCRISWNNEMPKFGTKSALFEYFLARILKNYSDIWNQHLEISVIPKFCDEREMPNFGNKNTDLGIFD